MVLLADVLDDDDDDEDDTVPLGVSIYKSNLFPAPHNSVEFPGHTVEQPETVSLTALLRIVLPQ